jgi:hypothetical protein
MSGGVLDQSDPRNGNRTIHRTMSIKPECMGDD